MKAKLILVILALCSALAAHASSPPPPGWRLPTQAEWANQDDSWRGVDPAKYKYVEGQFQGAKTQVTVFFLVSTDGKEYGLFYHGFGENYRQLDKGPIEHLKGRGLSRLPPGKHLTACGKGCWPCKPGEPGEIDLPHEVFIYFYHEASSAAYVWSTERHKFESIALSD